MSKQIKLKNLLKEHSISLAGGVVSKPAFHTDMSVTMPTLRFISNHLNRRPEKIKSDSTLEDLAEMLVENKKASIKFDFDGCTFTFISRI